MYFSLVWISLMVQRNKNASEKYLIIFINVYVYCISPTLGQVKVSKSIGPTQLPAVPWQWFGSAICETTFTIYLSLCTKTADPNPCWGTHVKASFHHQQLFMYLYDLNYITLIVQYMYDFYVRENTENKPTKQNAYS